MQQLNVCYGPSAKIAIISPDPSTFLLLKLDTEEVVSEHAPHMWNLGHDPFVRSEKIVDEQPFSKVRERLDILVRCMSTFDGMLRLIDPELSHQLKVEYAEVANRYATDPLAVAYAREIFLRLPLPQAAVITASDLALLAPSLREVLEETVTKWRPHAY